MRIERGHRLFGVFPDATWRRLIDDSGVERVDAHVVFVGRRPAGREILAADRGRLARLGLVEPVDEVERGLRDFLPAVVDG